jgi:hypothetical protein
MAQILSAIKNDTKIYRFSCMLRNVFNNTTRCYKNNFVFFLLKWYDAHCAPWLHIYLVALQALKSCHYLGCIISHSCPEMLNCFGTGARQCYIDYLIWVYSYFVNSGMLKFRVLYFLHPTFCTYRTTESNSNVQNFRVFSIIRDAKEDFGWYEENNFQYMQKFLFELSEVTSQVPK